MPTPEGRLVNAILTYLELRGIYAWRNNSGAYKAGKRYIKFGKPGSSDIIGCMPGGTFLAIEVKQPGRYPTRTQKAFLESIEASGGLAFVARSIDDVRDRVEEAI